MDTHTQTNANSMLSWIALIVGIIALVLAWMAYNRAGVDLEAQIEREVDEALVELGQEIQEAEQEVRDETADGLEAGSENLREGADNARTDEEGI